MSAINCGSWIDASKVVLWKAEPEINVEAEVVFCAVWNHRFQTPIICFTSRSSCGEECRSVRQVPANRPLPLDKMSKDEFNANMARGLAQAKACEEIPADKFFATGTSCQHTKRPWHFLHGPPNPQEENHPKTEKTNPNCIVNIPQVPSWHI